MAEQIDLNGRIALVTGGGKNIGRACATKLANAGAKVAITYQSNAAGAEATCKELQAQGLNVIPVHCELTEQPSVVRAIAEIVEKLGTLDIVVHNAAIRPPVHLEDTTTEWWDLIMNTNARGAFYINQIVFPGMLERNWGRLIFIGGIALYTGSVHTARDCAKTACIGMMRSLSLLGTPHQVTSNMVHPGFVDTKHDDLKFQGNDARRVERMKRHRMGHGSVADDPAGMVLFLASEYGRFISGQELFVTGGMPPHLGI
jgi:NAD(P)-dependent dehydrogenase (short-subunit alcohol dehydrogenase family)